jgi:hypothetical protein
LQTLILEAFTHIVRLLQFFAENFPGAHAIIDLPRARAIIESSLEPPRHRRVLPGASASSFPMTINPLYPPPSSPTRVGDANDHAGAIPKLAMLFPSPQQCCPPRAHDVVHQVSFLSPRCHRLAPSPTPQCHHPPRARNVIVPMTPQSSCRP